MSRIADRMMKETTAKNYRIWDDDPYEEYETRFMDNEGEIHYATCKRKQRIDCESRYYEGCED